MAVGCDLEVSGVPICFSAQQTVAETLDARSRMALWFWSVVGKEANALIWQQRPHVRVHLGLRFNAEEKVRENRVQTTEGCCTEYNHSEECQSNFDEARGNSNGPPNDREVR
jgi:hypothetical protein